MVKVDLVDPPLPKGVYRHLPLLPIGLAYLAAILEENGHEVRVLDCPALGLTHERLKKEFAAFEPDVVGITSMTPLIESVIETANIVKEVNPRTMVVLGGPHATFMDEAILSEAPSVDVVVRGEGEQTILELVRNTGNLDDLDKIEGITFRRKGQIIRNANRPFIEKIDELPYPALKHFSLDNYRIFGKLRLPVITSRGCPFQCSYCVTSRVFGKRVRMRNPEKVLDELEWLRKAHGADAFAFYDDTLTFDKKRINNICEGITKRKIAIPWDCSTRVDHISRELLATMKKAGCRLINLGIESGCQQTLDAMNKGTSVDQNEKAIKWVKDAGISIAASIIVGYPGETVDTIKQTFESIKKAKPDEVYVCVATPYPGTDLYDLVHKLGWKMSPDWSRYDTMNSVFENPDLPGEKLDELRKDFYSDFYSPSYVVREMLKRNFYSQMFARAALNHIFWRIRGRF